MFSSVPRRGCTRTPRCAQTKLIAEPWDVGQDGQLRRRAASRPGWSEWNGKYRDTVRGFLAQPPTGLLGNFATRFSGSAGPVRSHPAPADGVGQHRHDRDDGFTLRDLVSYGDKAQPGQRREQP